LRNIPQQRVGLVQKNEQKFIAWSLIFASGGKKMPLIWWEGHGYIYIAVIARFFFNVSNGKTIVCGTEIFQLGKGWCLMHLITPWH
jgi:hypothetical protein